jgi:hypothetical protein
MARSGTAWPSPRTDELRRRQRQLPAVRAYSNYSEDLIAFLAARLKRRLESLRERLDASYPFEHARGPIPIGDQVVGT